MTTEITYEAWMAELDKHRNIICAILTKEEYEFVKYARENEHPVAWYTLTSLFNKEFPNHITKRKTLADRYYRSQNHYE